MNQWLTLFKKEMLGYVRDRKWLWVPLVFILLAIFDPISNYYLPQILEAVGGLPDGAVFQLPEYSNADATLMSLAQLSSIGVLIIVLISMGTIAGERKSGMAELILVKPVSFVAYILSKWASLLVLVWAAYLVGMLFAWYYIGILYDFIPVGDFILVTLFYGLWLTLVATISIFYNTMFKSTGLVAFSTIGTVLLMSIITSVFGEKLSYSPNNLSQHIFKMLTNGSITGELVGSAVTTIIGCIVLITVSFYIFRKKEHAG